LLESERRRPLGFEKLKKEKLIARDDLPTATIAKAVLVMKAKAGSLSSKLGTAAGKRLIEAVEKTYGASSYAQLSDERDRKQLAVLTALASVNNNKKAK